MKPRSTIPITRMSTARAKTAFITTRTPLPANGLFGEKIQPGMTHTLFNTPNIPYVHWGSRIKDFFRKWPEPV